MGRQRGRSQMEDLTQDIFLLLFEAGGRALSAWDPERGLSLANWVGLLAERETTAFLRSGRRAAWREDPTLDSSLDLTADEGTAEAVLASRETLTAVLEGIRDRLSPTGLHLFELSVVEERPIEEVARMCAMTPNAVYTWRSRLTKLAREIRDELHPDSSKSPLAERTS